MGIWVTVLISALREILVLETAIAFVVGREQEHMLEFLTVSFIFYTHEAAIVVGCSAFASVMAFSSFFCHSPIAFKLKKTIKPCETVGKGQKCTFAIRSYVAGLCNQQIAKSITGDWSFIGGSRVIMKPNFQTFVLNKKRRLANSQLASNVFTLGTAAVLPFYTLMVVAPHSQLTKKSMESSIPYVALGILYTYLLYLSWTPETVQMIFASEYLLPELSSIGKMFSSEMTLASAWIHLLVVDLFAARQVFLDGLENQIETRHSVSLCLFFCPIGILTHVITKAMTKTTRKGEQATSRNTH